MEGGPFSSADCILVDLTGSQQRLGRGLYVRALGCSSGYLNNDASANSRHGVVQLSAILKLMPLRLRRIESQPGFLGLSRSSPGEGAGFP